MEQLLERRGEEKPGIPLVGWTTTHELLATVVDVLNHLLATLVQVHDEQGRRPDVSPMARPVTALDRVEARQARDAHRRRVAMMRPRE